MHASTGKEKIFQTIFPAKLILINKKDRNEKTWNFPQNSQSVGSEGFIILAEDERKNYQLPEVHHIY